MKNIMPLIALGLLVTGCADVAPPVAPSVDGPAIFQADTAQTPGHIAQCVYQPYKGRSDVRLMDLPGGGEEIVAAAEVIQFIPTASGTHVEIHPSAQTGHDPLGFVKQARVCGAMSGS